MGLNFEEAKESDVCTLLTVRRKYVLVRKVEETTSVGIHMRALFSLEVDTNVVVAFAYIYVLIYLHVFHFLMLCLDGG